MAIRGMYRFGLVVTLFFSFYSAAGEEGRATVIYSKKDAPSAPKVGELEQRDSVTQYGITWTFDKKAPTGRFVNGDYYVVGPVTITAIDPKPLFGDEVKDANGRDQKFPGKFARNGSSLNPVCTTGRGGYDSRASGSRYDPALFAHLPIKMQPGDALVSTVSTTNEFMAKNPDDPIRVAAVFSCLAEPQPADTFRPSYCDSKNSPIYQSRNLKRELLLKLPRLESMPKTLDGYAAKFQKPWLDTMCFDFGFPWENMPHYAQQMAEQVGEGSLLLLMDYPETEKEKLLINLIQVGIDFWGMVRAGRSWVAHGGHGSARKWPVLFAGLLLGDEKMQSPKKHYPGVVFGEDNQTAMCPYTYKGPPCPEGKTFEQSWTGAKVIFTGHSTHWHGKQDKYWGEGWGPVDLFHPKDWPKPYVASEAYRRANTSAAWIGQALAARLMHAEKTWNHDAFFAYVDRWMTEDDTPFVQQWPDIAKAKFGEFGRQGYVWGPAWVKEMWKKHRNNLPPAPDGHKDPPAEQTWR